jgi:hypothetical protein
MARRPFMVKRAKLENEKHYRELLAEQRQSGLSIRAFAAARGLAAGTLSSWAHQLRKRDAERSRTTSLAAPSFVPVTVVGVKTARVTEPAKTSGSYEVVLGEERVLRLPADFDEERVAALVRAVASC